ncbi:nucleotidyltransferase domain-containing protein [Telluribacter sp. SYSU D00476]|uniref:nucleotidyltransferase domain-containing protein n=1 Tax=Telluribacter sp. SYSU D00476 TaxID=2811430 RepID=UPI001FF31604|nr:nucleotidyltransferase domain-containing protein [Telluribacter sp. SYSU D00476]
MSQKDKINQKDFAEHASNLLSQDPYVVGLAVGGSWISGEVDPYSDLDLLLVVNDHKTPDKALMMHYAGRLGTLLSAFTGEHVGERRLLICLYDEPLLHVDIKFVTLAEFGERIETPAVLLDKEDRLQQVLAQTVAQDQPLDLQWIEDRFWIWVHYALLKIGRGEYFEAMDFLSYLRMTVFGPLLLMKNGRLPRGVRKVEMYLEPNDLLQLKGTVALPEKTSLLKALMNAVVLYRSLRSSMFNDEIKTAPMAEEKVMLYFEVIANESLPNIHE